MKLMCDLKENIRLRYGSARFPAYYSNDTLNRQRNTKL